MSQTAVFVKVNDVLYQNIERHIPDSEEVIDIIEDMIEEFDLSESSDYDVEANWYEIGDGESGMDTFFNEEDLIDWYKKDKFNQKVEEAGQYAEHIQSKTLKFTTDEWDEED